MNGQTLTKGFVLLSGGATAVYNSSGLAYYHHAEWLGSSRFASLPTGTSRLYYDGACAPYGENYAESGTTDRVFAGMGQDTVSSSSYPLYDALYREYHPTWGRWVNPDPAGVAAVDPGNPQSWNRYAYVTNNPLALTDPTGLGPERVPPPMYAPYCGSGIGCYTGGSGGGGGGGVDCYLNGMSTPCGVVENAIGAGAAYPLPPPYQGWEPVRRGGQEDCPGCYYETWGPFKDAIWDPDNPWSWGLWGIFWKQTNNTTWTFESPLSFQDTVQTLKNVGFVENKLDYLDYKHPGKLDLRDANQWCSAHVDVTKASGQNGEPTTGDVHLDTANPWWGGARILSDRTLDP